jgi:hypothetical protein
LEQGAMTPLRTKGDMAREVLEISRLCQMLLHGRGPEVQSAVLGDLVSLWLAGHWPREVREPLLADFVEVVRNMIPASEEQILDQQPKAGEG